MRIQVFGKRAASGSASDNNTIVDEKAPSELSEAKDQETAVPASPQRSSDEAPDASLGIVKTLVIMLSLVLAMFLVSLDRVIVGVAIPTITDQFDSFGDIAWYSSAYMLTLACSQLVWGRIYKFNRCKPMLLTSIVIFEVGSVICGAAPTSNALIAGRAVAGLGAGGIFSGAIQVLLAIIPLEKRPTWIGLFQMTFGISSALGPLLGGAFTTKVSWRWCFYINLPLGAVTILAVLFLYHDPDANKPREKLSFFQQIVRLDPVGFAVLVPAIVCLVLALQWGGTTYAWNSARVIALFVLCGVFLVAFIISQYFLQERGLLPPRLFMMRAVSGASFFTLFLAASFTVALIYLPIWFQTIKASSALHSSYQTLPFVLALSIFAILGGRLTQSTGYYTPPMIFACIITPIGIGLASTFKVSTPHPQWIGYEFLWGAGTGMALSGGNMAVQAALPKSDVPLGIATVLLFQQLGGAIFIPVAQNLLQNQLVSQLKGIPGINASAIASIGATEIRSAVPPQYLDQLVTGYNEALKSVWYLSLALCCVSVLPLAIIPVLSIKKQGAKARQGEMQKKSAEHVKEETICTTQSEAAAMRNGTQDSIKSTGENPEPLVADRISAMAAAEDIARKDLHQ